MYHKLVELVQKCSFKIKSSVNPGVYHLPVKDYFRRGETLQKNALLIYRAMPFHLPPSHPIYRSHQNLIQSRWIAEVLDQMGFNVDVLEYSKPTLPLRDSYDLVISHNCAVDPRQAFVKDSIKIYLAAGTEHREHNLRQQQRLEAFEGRRGHHEIELHWDVEDMLWTETADAIFCFGNDSVANTWRNRFHCPVFAFQNTAIKDIETIFSERNPISDHFLFLGSRQQLAKGLDLLLEAFAECHHLHLHICGHYLKDHGFCGAYRDLFKKSNIHSHGWVDVTGRRFRKIAEKCAFTISASCSEGSPGSITNAMRLGMIPLVSPECGLDDNEGVIIMRDLSVSGIIEMIQQCAAMNIEELQTLSELGKSRARRDFTEHAFKQRWHQMLTETLSESRENSFKLLK